MSSSPLRVALFGVWLALLMPGVAGAQQPALNFAPSSDELAGRAPDLFASLRDDLFAVIDPLDVRIVIIDRSGRVLGSSAPLPFVPEILRGTPETVDFGDAKSRQWVSIRRTVDPAAIGELTVLPRAPVAAASVSPVLRRTGKQSIMIRDDGAIEVRAIGRGYLADATLLGRDAGGQRYVQTSEIVKEKPVLNVRVSVQRFSLAGKLVDIADVPVADMDTVPKRFVAISPDGQATAMVPTETGLFLQKLEFRSPRGPVAAARPQRTPVSATVVPSDRTDADRRLQPTPAAPPATPPRTRSQIIDAAHEFLNVNWTMSEENFSHPGIQNRCSKTQQLFWLRPTRFTPVTIGKNIGPMPYKWGGGDTPAQFLKRLAAGKLAGSICTCREPEFNQCQVAEAAGVDCSGFVSAAWGIRKLGTTSLSSAARPVAGGLTAVKPGDALNNSGSHVRLFVRFKPGANLAFDVLESATNARCEGVCQSIYGVAQLGKYKPLQYRGLTDAR